MNYYSLKYISEKTVTDLTAELKSKFEASGYYIVNELNLADKINEELKINFDDYQMLGVCNLKFAQEILSQEKGAGLFLPCKVVIYKDNNATKVEMQRPTFMSEFFYSKHIESVTDKIEVMLDEIIREVV